MDNETLGSLLAKRRGQVPSFNAMRFLAASAVLLSHSFGAAENRQAEEPLRYLTGVLELGSLAVCTFFFISGFVITQSCERSSTSSYLIKRTARIMPGLILVTAFSALIIGPMMTSYAIGEYFSDPKFRQFFLNCVFILKGQLPGVFQNNPSGDHLNVSLWTLRHEVLCYVLILFVLANRKFAFSLVVVLALGLAVLANPALADAAAKQLVSLQAMLHLRVDVAYLFRGGIDIIPFFFAGALAYFLREHIPINTLGFAISIFLMVAAVSFKHIFPVFPFALGYAIIYLGFMDGRFSSLFKKNDYSYGIYLFAFPIQQTVAAFSLNGATWWQNTLVSYPIVLILAALSWHLIERPSLEFAKGLDKRRHSLKPA